MVVVSALYDLPFRSATRFKVTIGNPIDGSSKRVPRPLGRSYRLEPYTVGKPMPDLGGVGGGIFQIGLTVPGLFQAKEDRSVGPFA